MKLTIEVSAQTVEYLRRLTAELGPLTRLETIAAHLVEKAAQQAQAQQGK